MAGTTISGSYTTSVTLSNPATQNPATVSSTGHINATSGSVLYGTNIAAWSIYNFGTLIGPARGIFLTAGGIISNAATGLISGGYRGIDITGAAGTVTNAGSIAGGMQQGIRLTRGGSMVNASGGNIAGGGTYAAIYINNGGSIANAGSIFNIADNGNLSVTNLSGGIISKQIFVRSGTLNLQNAGVISRQIRLVQGGTIDNLAGGTLSAIYANNGATTLVNYGSIVDAYLLAGGSITNRGWRGNWNLQEV